MLMLAAESPAKVAEREAHERSSFSAMLRVLLDQKGEEMENAEEERRDKGA